MAVKIKLKRLGKIRAPYYRIVVADSRTKRDGRAIEEIGKYHPKADPSFIEVDSERAQHWLKVGAQPTDPVRKILEVTGDWQKFKGLPGAEGTLRVAEPKTDKKGRVRRGRRGVRWPTAASRPRPRARTADAKASEAQGGGREGRQAGQGRRGRRTSPPGRRRPREPAPLPLRRRRMPRQPAPLPLR